jgi:hypothetical protein
MLAGLGCGSIQGPMASSTKYPRKEGINITKTTVTSGTNQTSIASNTITIGLILGTLIIICLQMFASIFVFLYLNQRNAPILANNIEVPILNGMKIIPTGTIILGDRLGMGNFGDVIKGHWNGTIVALKRLKDPSKSKEFTAEANMLWFGCFNILVNINVGMFITRM